MNKANIILGYIRVSTNDQFVNNQKYEILEYARKNDLTVSDWIEISISSTKSKKKRRLDEVFTKLGQNGTLIVTEISRLGRSTSEVLQIIEELLKNGNRVIITKKNLDLKGKSDLVSKILLTVFSMLAELERDLIVLRTTEALASRKAQGVILGKPKGTIQVSIYDDKVNDIKECLAKGMNITNISKWLGIGKRSSLTDFIRSRRLK